MGAQQFVSDLFVAIMEGAPQHQSVKLDDYYRRYDQVFGDRANWERRFMKDLKFMKQALPSLIRFTMNKADFYTVFEIVDELHQMSDVSLASDRNVKAVRETLVTFDQDYTAFNEKRYRDPDTFPLLERYRESIVGRQRELEVREERAKIIKGILKPALAYRSRDPQRLFSPEQRNYIWQRSEDHLCCRCNLSVSEDEYEPDHYPLSWKDGGPTSIANGAVSHKVCNQTAGGALAGQG